MPFDECREESGGSGKPHRKPSKEYITLQIEAIVVSAQVNNYCVGCTMWGVGKGLVSTHVALTIKALEHHLGREMTTEEITKTVHDAVQEICDAIGEMVSEYDHSKEDKRNG